MRRIVARMVLRKNGDGVEDHIKDGIEEEEKTHISYFTSLYEGADLLDSTLLPVKVLA